MSLEGLEQRIRKLEDIEEIKKLNEEAKQRLKEEKAEQA